MERRIKGIKQKVAILLMLSFLACSMPQKSATSNILNLQTGAVLGLARFIETKKGVLLKVELQTKKTTTLGIHIHQYGDCSDVEGKSAGGHWNPTEESHGTWGEGGFHSGDLGNIKTDKNGKGSLEVLDVFGRWSLDEKTTTSVLNKSIIVHAGMDDMTSQPSGAAGTRKGCGEIINTK
jgi:Cu-Zn family superoxide dismutase